MKTIFFWFLTHKKIAALCAYTWAAVILVACLLPGKDVPSLSLLQHDKLLHFAIFGLLSFLILFCFNRLSLKNCLLVWLICTAYGYVVELLQGSGISVGRAFDHFDALADSLGAALGVLLFFGINTWVEKSLA
jgi:VanZ family protein